MLIIVTLTAILAAQTGESTKAAPAVATKTSPAIFAKRLAYMELRRKEWAIKMQQDFSQLAKSEAEVRRRWKKKAQKRKKRKALGEIAGYQKWVSQQIRSTKSKQWVPALDFGHPVVHAAGSVISGKDRTVLSLVLEKINGPQEAICTISFTYGVFVGGTKIVVFVRHQCKERFLFRIPTQPLLVGKSVPLKGWFVIVGKQTRNVTKGVQVVKEDVWLVEPISKLELFRPPIAMPSEKKIRD